nr:unnamed protein product [Callosobruchus chinensis]
MNPETWLEKDGAWKNKRFDSWIPEDYNKTKLYEHDTRDESDEDPFAGNSDSGLRCNQQIYPNNSDAKGTTGCSENERKSVTRSNVRKRSRNVRSWVDNKFKNPVNLK